MFCSQCGSKVSDRSKFCSNCGAPIESSYAPPTIKKLICQDCGGVMSIDNDRQVISCPFCGSREIILESDGLKAERVRSDARVKTAYANRDAKIEKSHAERDAKISEHEMEAKKAKYQTVYVAILCLAMILILLIMRSLGSLA